MDSKQVRIQTNRMIREIETGIELPFLTQIENCSSSIVIIDSKDRIAGSVSSFQVDLYRAMSRPRYFKILRATLPKICNVNPNNYTLQITHELGTTAQFNLTSGIYNPTTLANELTSKINSALSAVPIADSVTTTFDPISRTFKMSSVGVKKFYINSECSFISRGAYLAPFESLPGGSLPTKTVNYSGISSMLYTRYLTIQSQSLSRYIYASASSSRGNLAFQMIGSIDMTRLYTPQDFDVSVPFRSVYESMSVDKMNISLLNSNREMPRIIDIKCVDEWGLLLETSLNIGGSYPANDLGISLFLEVTF